MAPPQLRRGRSAVLVTIFLLTTAALVAPRPAPAHAQVASGSGFASAVPCMGGTPTFATTSMANTIDGAAQVAAATDPALLQITSGSSAKLADIGSSLTFGQNLPIANGLGATYGLAYDDGSVSGIRRLFIAAYLKRTVALGTAGPGAIYAYRFATGTWSLAATVPNVGSAPSRTLADPHDSGVADQIGTVGLGDLEVAPDGRTLYAMNLYTRQIARYDISGGALVALPALSIPFSLISTNPAVQADLRPFAISTWSVYTPVGGGPPVLLVGLVDSAARSARGAAPWTYPKAYVLYATYAGTGSWGLAVAQDLHAPGLRDREAGATFMPPPDPSLAQASGWNPWFPISIASISKANAQVRFPEPLLTTLAVTQDGQTMYVGLRDRLGDQLFSKAAPAGQISALSQGDVLTYKLTGGVWTLQGNVYADTFDDNTHLYPGSTPSHIENLMGGLGVSIGGTPPTGPRSGTPPLPPRVSEQVLTTALLGNSTSGTRVYGASGGGIVAQQTLVPSTAPAGGKATALGDVEVLCRYALVGGRVWQEINGNNTQDVGEPDFPGVSLEVFTGSLASDPALASLTTDAQGRYLFAVPPNTPVNIRIAASSRASLSAQGWRIVDPNTGGNIGGSDATDSDINPAYGYIELTGQNYGSVGGGITGSAVPTLMHRGDQRDLDIGLIRLLSVGQIGDQVWDDTNHNGVQDAGEPGHAGYAVTLIPDPQGMALLPGTYPQTVTTDASGRYLFASVPPGRYAVRFGTPVAPFVATLRDVGGNDMTDSDADSSTGYTSPLITIATAQIYSNTSLDLGLYGGFPDVWVSKAGPAQMLVGSTFAYTLSYGNTGSLPAAGVQLRDTLPAGVSYVSASPAPSSVSGQTVTWSLGTLASGQSGSISLSVRAPASLGTATSQPILNTASISTTTPNDPPGNNSNSRSGTVVRPEVSLAKTAPATALVGDEFSYRLSYANTGSIAATSVVIADTLPPGLTFTRFIQSPGAACGYAAASRQVSCTVATLALGASTNVVFGVTASTAAASSVANTASISTATAGDDPTNNSSSATTAIQFPNPGVTLSIAPTPFPVGTGGSITATYRNTGTGLARSTTLSLTMPVGVILGTLPGGCAYTAATRVIACALGDLAVGTSGSRIVPLSLPATFAADSLSVAAAIATTTPERPADLADNNASASVSVVRPNVFVTATGPTSIVGQGSVFWYTIGYGNRYRANPSLTRAADGVLLVVTLPADVTYVQADVPPTSVSGPTITWSLGQLAANASGQIHIVVQTKVPAGATLHLNADISTTTPGDDPADNHATVDTAVVPPPTQVSQSASNLTLAIHSEFDPNSQDANPTNGVYLSTGTQIAWPAGEVLDFTPRLTTLRFPDEPLPFPYEYRARVVGWSVANFTVNGAARTPQVADSRGVAGCRAGASPARAPQKLTGCAYAYLGGASRSAIESPSAITELQLATQAHAYWTQPTAPRMRSDVYLYTLDPLRSVKIGVQVEVEVWVVNTAPGAINGVPLPEIPVVPLPDPARQLIAQEFTVNLLVPRSVVGPGSE